MNELTGYEKQRERAKKLYDSCFMQGKNDKPFMVKVRNLCEKHSELIDDFAHLKELNRVMSERFDEVTKRFPLVKDIDCLIATLTFERENNQQLQEYEIVEALDHRIKRLCSFRKIVEALEKHSEEIRPKSYKEAVDSKQVQNDYR